jgi:hypothetical protein
MKHLRQVGFRDVTDWQHLGRSNPHLTLSLVELTFKRLDATDGKVSRGVLRLKLVVKKQGIVAA